MNQSCLFDAKESYNLDTVRQVTRIYVKKKMPTPSECQDYSDYLSELEDEYRLELAHRLRIIADELEESVLKVLKEDIKEKLRKGY